MRRLWARYWKPWTVVLDRWPYAGEKAPQKVVRETKRFWSLSDALITQEQLKKSLPLALVRVFRSEEML